MNVDIKVTPMQSTANQKKTEKIWQQLWKEQLINRNNQIISQMHKKQLPKSNRLWQAASSGKTMVEIHNYTLQEHGEGPYSQYLPLAQSMTLPNQIDNCFPYMQHLSSKKSEKYEEELYEIAQKLSSSKCLDQWRQICRKYALGIGLVELVHIYLHVLTRGTVVLSQYAAKYNCKLQCLTYQVFQLGKLFNKKPKIFTNKVDVGLAINLDNMSRTFKLLFCQICHIYDCDKHNISDTAVQHNYQYTRTYKPQAKLKTKIDTAICIMKQIGKIFNNEQPQSLQDGCSADCYKLLTAEKWQNLSNLRKKKNYSRIFRVYVQMGIHLYCFDPCQIKTLFGKNRACDNRIIQTNVKCCDVFYYFIHDYGLRKKLQSKFYQNEQDYLRNISKEASNPEPVRMKKKLKSKSKPKKHYNNTEDSFNAVCFHYFTNCEPEDIGCFSCECRKRGYCLPSCQCSQLCMLQLKGCKCKASTSGCLSNCPCYKQKRVCMPQFCQCFHSKNSKCANWCENSQIALSCPKLTRIAKSTIKQAGLGLFAGQFIQKGEFVIKYIGQIIHSDSLQKMRQNLNEKGSFYNFKLDNHTSIDSRYFGNKSRFINHSVKDQNLRVEKIKVREQQLLIFRASRDIDKDQELFFDYNGGGALSDHKDKFPFIE